MTPDRVRSLYLVVPLTLAAAACQPVPEPSPTHRAPADCQALREGPFPTTELTAPKAIEDLTIDGAGRLIGSDGEHLWASTREGPAELVLPNAPLGAGIRVLPNGDYVAAVVDDGTVVRITPQGGKEVIATGLAWPNGLEVDLTGKVWVTEFDGSTIRRIDPQTGSVDVVADDLVAPNGIAFSQDYRRLYVTTDGDDGGDILAYDLNEAGDLGEPQTFAHRAERWILDGLSVDACGNVYSFDWDGGPLVRFGADGSGPTSILPPRDVPGPGRSSMSNGVWGRGKGGFETDHMYIVNYDNGGVFEVDLGVPSKRLPGDPE